MPIVVPHAVRRVSLGTEHLNDLDGVILFADDSPVYDKPVAFGSMHRCVLSLLNWPTPKSTVACLSDASVRAYATWVNVWSGTPAPASTRSPATSRSATPPHVAGRDTPHLRLVTGFLPAPQAGGWVENSAAMEGYFEDGDGWEENALVRVL